MLVNRVRVEVEGVLCQRREGYSFALFLLGPLACAHLALYLKLVLPGGGLWPVCREKIWKGDSVPVAEEKIRGGREAHDMGHRPTKLGRFVFAWAFGQCSSCVHMYMYMYE